MMSLTHASIDIHAQQTFEPAARTCLSGFELLMRHVVLWEGDVSGEWKITDDLWNSSVVSHFRIDFTFGLTYGVWLVP